MNILSNKDIKKYFLTKKSNIDSISKVDLVLSPEFYWVRIFDIPVTSEKRANKVLPSLFDDILPNGKFEYYSIKIDNNRYIGFAFNNDEILEAIKKSGLSLSSVNSIYFGQTQMIRYKNFVVDDSTFVYDNEILIKVPNMLCSDAKKIDNLLTNFDDSKHKIQMKFYSNKIDAKYVYILSALFLTIAFFNTIKYFDYAKNIERQNDKMQNIKSINLMPKTMIQTNAILKDMQNNLNEANKFKEALEYISNFKVRTKTGSIEKIEYKNSSIIVIFKGVELPSVKRYIEKKYSLKNVSKNGDYVNFEVQI